MFCGLIMLSAAEYSTQHYKSLKTNKQKLQYAYNSTVSQDSKTDVCHMIAYLNHVKSLKNSNLTIQQIDNAAKIFKSFGYYKTFLYTAYVRNGHLEYVQNKLKQDSSGIDLTVLKSCLLNRYISQKNKEKIWKTGCQLLLNDGVGITDTQVAMLALSSVFRYKPSNITKEQQIELLSKLAQIYPIPGTDLNKWKGFMGFVGFKYKQLTGKDLF